MTSIAYTMTHFNIAALMKNVLQCGNPFNLEQPKSIMNLAPAAILEKDEEDFLMNFDSSEKAANGFYESCLPEKNSCWKAFLKLGKAPRK